jgi:hypothetical protein
MTSSIFPTSAEYARAAAEQALNAVRAELATYASSDAERVVTWSTSANFAARLCAIAAEDIRHAPGATENEIKRAANCALVAQEAGQKATEYARNYPLD